MKNLIFLLAAIALYLHFYPNEELTNFYNEKKAYFQGELNELGSTKIRLKASKIYDDLKNDLEHFSDTEIQRLEEISSSRANVKDFYYDVCTTEKRDVVFYIKNEQKVCSTISKYQSLL